MRRMLRFSTLTIFLAALFHLHCLAQVIYDSAAHVIVGAERTGEYLPLLKGKNIGLVVNQTSRIGAVHLADTLIKSGIAVKKVFAPEHGFRGVADAGESISSGIDSTTGLPIISLYGDHKKPTADDLKNIELLVYDIQDVGVRFYTYISTLHYVMEACAENNIGLIVLDRPNPNGFYVDGPVLDSAFTSFVGMDPVPVVYGMTPGEYAQMLNGEGWLKGKLKCDLQVIPCGNYSHQTLYQLPISPSPNLRTMNAIYLYPSVCFFEGTPVSVGRGTEKPFQLIGYPEYSFGKIQFTPYSTAGAKSPMYAGRECSGYDLSVFNTGYFIKNKRIMLNWLIDFYKTYPEKEKFFAPFFDKLAGTDQLRLQIISGMTETLIRKTWEPGLNEFKAIRKKYLLYPDFE